MELKDYTEEQLRAELKRRYDERQSDRGTGLGIPKNDSAAAVRYADALIKVLKEK